MLLRSIELFHVAVPLKTKIRHASHERTVSDNLIVRATLDSGHVGYGEGVPRSYVTGETIETCFAALSKFDPATTLGDVRDPGKAIILVSGMTLPEIEADPRGMFGNAARCALELALLDALGRASDRSRAPEVNATPAPWVPGSRRRTNMSYFRKSGTSSSSSNRGAGAGLTASGSGAGVGSTAGGRGAWGVWGTPAAAGRP